MDRSAWPPSVIKATNPLGGVRIPRAAIGHGEVHAQDLHVRLRLRDVDTVDVDDRVGAGELRGPNLAAEVVAAAESQVQAQLLVQQDLADGLHPEGGEHAQAQLGQVAVGGLLGKQGGLLPSLITSRARFATMR